MRGSITIRTNHAQLCCWALESCTASLTGSFLVLGHWHAAIATGVTAVATAIASVLVAP